MLHFRGVAICENLLFARLHFANFCCSANYNNVMYVILILASLKCDFSFVICAT
jgi:hypothetical protein